MRVTLPWYALGKAPGEPVDLPDEEAQSLLRQGLAQKAGSKRAKSASRAPREEDAPTPEMGTDNENPDTNAKEA